ncbi:septal ring lytic transglycosylase RlpA family protein [Methylotenera sp.]|uniref:septal ring lytic transglycosylase RlpA family protein n=1 Tax=Methylotenera sp. TaxID=2051956 RepID=UPI002730B416|nr:septal ring lytic transglycosylase RlpA family protein [Methylotenera sp.]MDP2070555.1 septal ring lytic transglycosylase RlpA family protein [Methylotenera sp.]MDP3006155.1 septal ring lytic transglycosylase RlpA family protein [Methylotenera sp.]
MLTLKTINLRNHLVLLTMALLTACSQTPTLKSAPKQTSAESTSLPKTDTSSKPDSKAGGGGYYLDDGPGENAPANLDGIPGAILKTEQINLRANKPYSALGQKYTPMTTYVPYKKQGVASWYGKRFHGKKTSTGEIYDMYAMTAAHTVLPIPSYAKVTNPANGRSVIVRINDRGPFKHSRLIDLSYAAAYQLRLIKQGSGLVEVETIDTSAEGMRKMSSNNSLSTVSPTESLSPNNETVVTLVPSAPATVSVATNTSFNNIQSTQYYVQAGAFKNEVNGTLLQKKIQGLDMAENVGVANVYNDGLYRVKLGPYASKNEADISAANIRKQLNTSAHVTN